MFKMTEAAYNVLKANVEREKTSSDEVLFVRLSMGIG